MQGTHPGSARWVRKGFLGEPFRFLLSNTGRVEKNKTEIRGERIEFELTRVNNAIRYFENQLSEFERKASFAGVPGTGDNNPNRIEWKILNPKHEFETSTNVQNPNDQNRKKFWILNLGFVSGFDIRISDFGVKGINNHQKFGFLRHWHYEVYEQCLNQVKGFPFLRRFWFSLPWSRHAF